MIGQIQASIHLIVHCCYKYFILVLAFLRFKAARIVS